MLDRAYFAYIVASRAWVPYTGVTGKLRERMLRHKAKRYDGFTAKYNCDRLVWFETFDDPHEAIAREKQIKGWRRAQTRADPVPEPEPGGSRRRLVRPRRHRGDEAALRAAQGRGAEPARRAWRVTDPLAEPHPLVERSFATLRMTADGTLNEVKDLYPGLRRIGSIL